jgi:multiple sugar transport system ATP-binding protein
MATVHIKDLDIVLGGVSILQSMNLEIQDGEFLVLLGPSGCGKSTLLHSIAGFNEVSDGAILIDGQDVTWADPKDRGIGMVFQSYALYPTMNVERNMSFGLRVAGLPKAEIEKRVARAADMLHLKELLNRRPSQLSGGQRQRVAIGRALVRDAKVFLFDEPLSNLDAKLRAELRRELKQLHKDLRTTMIYVTHDQVEAMTMATRIAVMLGGKIQQIDTPAAIYSRPANMFVAGFLGSPSMNFIEGTLQTDAGGTHFASNALAINLSSYPFQKPVTSGQRCVLGVRPESIKLCEPGASTQGQATVSLIEPMGASQIVWLNAQGTTLSVQLEAQATPAMDSAVGLQMAPRELSLFDAQTQERL